MATVIDINSTLSELVIEDPRRSTILTDIGIDFCCNGNRSLQDAVGEAGLNLDGVIAAITLPGESPVEQIVSRDQSELAHDIVDTHHAYMWAEMPRLTALVEKVYSVHGSRHPELEELKGCYLQAVAEIEPHMTEEERVVFPAISKLEKDGTAPVFGSFEQPFEKLRDEHEALGRILEQMRLVTNNYAVPEDACTSYTLMLNGLEAMDLDLREHIHKENNILFPQVLELEKQL